VCSRDSGRVEQACRELRIIAAGSDRTILPVQTDLTVAADIKRLVAMTAERYGRIDVLATNAGGPPVVTFPELEDDTWSRGVTLTLMSVVRLIREVVCPPCRNADGAIESKSRPLQRGSRWMTW
jgi:3-oxoacyl-[acyl-carrier protein] reductase